LIADIQRAVDQAPHLGLDLLSHTNDDNYTAEMPVVTLNSVSPCKHDQLRVLLVFGEHAREFVTSELALYLIDLLGNFHDVGLQFHGREWGDGDESETQDLTTLLTSCVSIKACLPVLPIVCRLV